MQKEGETAVGGRQRPLPPAADLLENHLAPAHTLSRAGLTRTRWELNPPDGANLLVKLRAAGMPLGEYVSGKIYYGIKTGLNAAFVIDAQKRRDLIAQDARSAEIIKPFLAGRDVKRYAPSSATNWLILFPNGWTDQQTDAPDKWQWLCEQYPAITRHLAEFAEKAQKRTDMGAYWWEVRACDYYQAFEQPKIIFPDIALNGQFTLDTDNAYLGNTAYVIAPQSDDTPNKGLKPLVNNEIYYLLSILNSKVVHYFYKQLSPEYRGGYLRFINQYIVQIPVPNIPQTDARYTQLVALVHTRLQRAAELAALETGVGLNAERAAELRHIQEELDAQIDALVYALYGLTDGEIALVEGV